MSTTNDVDVNNQTDTAVVAGTSEDWAYPMALSVFGAGAMLFLAMLFALFYLERQEGLTRVKRDVALFFLLAQLGLVIQLFYTGWNIYMPFLAAVPEDPVNTPMWFMALSLKYLPVAVLYVRLVIIYFGHPHLCPPGWTQSYHVRLSMGLGWMCCVLVLLHVPYLALWLTYQLFVVVNGIDDPRIYDLMDRLFYARISLDLFYLTCCIVMATMLHTQRNSLRVYDLDQTMILLFFFVSYLLYYIYYTFSNLTHFELLDKPAARIILPTWLIFQAVLVYVLWYLNLRAMLRRSSTDGRTGSNMQVVVGATGRNISAGECSEINDGNVKKEKKVVEHINQETLRTFVIGETAINGETR